MDLFGEKLGGFASVITPEEDDELDKIRDVLANQLSPSQIREAHRRADEEIANQENSSEVDSERRQISSKVRDEVWRRDQGKCVKCGSRVNLEFDHIIPVSKGGGDTARNIELLCQDCNRSKSDLIQ
ncbi:MAG: HNH endonuclease [Limisphaerales bacterium]